MLEASDPSARTEHLFTVGEENILQETALSFINSTNRALKVHLRVRPFTKEMK